MSLTLDDPDGDGKGAIDSVVLDGTDAKSTLTFKVTKAPSGDGFVRIGEIKGAQGTEAIKSISASGANIVGNGINLGGLVGGVSVHDVTNGARLSGGGIAANKTIVVVHWISDGTVLDFKSSITSLTAAQIGRGTIKAPAIGTLSIKGDLGHGMPGDLKSDVLLSGDGVAAGKQALGKLSVAGSITDAEISAGSAIGTFSAGTLSNTIVAADGAITAFTAANVNKGSITAQSFGSVLIKGNSLRGIPGDFESYLLATGQSLARGKSALTTLSVAGAIRNAEISVNGSLGALTAGSMSNSTVFADQQLKSATIKGMPGYDSSIFGSALSAFVNSLITADSIGTVKLASVYTDLDDFAASYGSKSFGVVARTSIKSVTVPAMNFFWKWKPAGLPDQGVLCFHVKRGGIDSLGNWGTAAVTDQNGEAVLRLAGQDVRFRVKDGTSDAPVSGVSVAVSANTGTPGLAVMLITGFYTQYPTKIVLLHGASADSASASMAANAAPMSLTKDSLTEITLSTVGSAIDVIEALDLAGKLPPMLKKGEHLTGNFLGVLDAVGLLAKSLSSLGVPIAETLDEKGILNLQPISNEEALNEVKNPLREDVILTALSVLWTGGATFPEIAPGIMAREGGFWLDSATISGCGGGNLWKLSLGFTDLYVCRKPTMAEMVASLVHAPAAIQGQQPNSPNPLAGGCYQLFSKTNLGLAFTGVLDSQGRTDISVPLGDYELKVCGGGGASPGLTNLDVGNNGGSATDQAAPPPSITGASLLYDGPVPANLAPGSQVHFRVLVRDAYGNTSSCDSPTFQVHNPAVAQVATIDSQSGWLTIGPDWGGSYVTATCNGVSTGPVVVSGSGPIGGGGGGGGGNQTWVMTSGGQSATLTVDTSGNFTGSGWMVSDPHGCTFPLLITSGHMSGTSMNFSASGAGCGITESGSGSGALDASFPGARSASGSMTIHITTPIGNEDVTGDWQATRTQ